MPAQLNLTWERADGRWLAAISLIALLLRAVHVLSFRTSAFVEHLFLDPKMYDTWAQRIAAGDWLGSEIFFQDPLYAYGLGVVYRLFGHEPLAAIVLQALVGASVPIWIYFAARPWVPAFATRSASLLAALYLPSLYYEGMILKTSSALAVCAFGCWLLSRALIAPSVVRWLGVGVAFGLTALLRGNFLALLPVLAIALLVRPAGLFAEHSSSFSRRRWRWALSLMLGGLIVLAPIMARNFVVGGEWVLATTNAGQNFYIGNHSPDASGQYDRLPFVDPNPIHERSDFKREAERRTGREMSANEVSRFWMAQATDWIRQEPSAWMALVWRKLRWLTAAFEVPDNLSLYVIRPESLALSLPLPGFGLLFPFACLGLLVTRRHTGLPRALAILTVAYVASILPFFVLARFRLLLLPALALFAGVGLHRLISALQSLRTQPSAKSRKALTLTVFILLLGFGWCHFPLRAVPGAPLDRAARAIGIEPTPIRVGTTYFNLGVIYAAEAKQAAEPAAWLSLAEQALTRASESEQDQASVWIELGKVQVRQEKLEQAAISYERATTLDPNSWRTYHAYGLVLRRLGRLQAAGEAFNRALALNRGSWLSGRELAEVLLELGQVRPALSIFEYLAQSRPEDPRIRRGLRDARAKLHERSELGLATPNR